MARRVNLTTAERAFQDKCNKLVLTGIKRECAKLKIKFSAKNEKKVRTSNGKFPLFVHPQSKRYERRSSSKKNAGRDLNEMEILYEREQGQMLAESPRFKDSNSPNYQNEMELTLSVFWDFLSMIADYQSMIVLLPWPPNNSPSVNSDSVRKYVDYKFLKRGEKLIYKATPVMTYKFPKIPHPRKGISSDDLRKEMKCVGTFHNPNSFKIFFAAINQVHENNNITGNYEPFCENCWFHFKDRKGFVLVIARMVLHITIMHVGEILPDIVK